MLSRRAALAALLIAIAAIATFGARPAQALDPDNEYDRIALTALKYEGSHGGQCWQFVKDVVREATGRQMGFDYREGFFEAGAVEITDIEKVRSGDIIQIVDDDWTAPDADYPGLHTSIVLTNLGGGVFDVIDSNQNWDEMVRLRPNYNPFEGAARYGLDVHIYRIVNGPLPGDAPGRDFAAGIALQAGDTGTVNTPGECLNLRTGGGMGNEVITCLPHGTRFTVLAEAVVVGTRYWAKVVTEGGQEGWVATDYVLKESLVTPAGGDDGPSQVLPYRSFVAGLAVQ